ncbi:MAG: hypothetical protein QOE05_3393 [Actinomycetota bacterium]|jgi:hypothetical protein|nr:hypothetical protein [Actinomycetota bacterium]
MLRRFIALSVVGLLAFFAATTQTASAVDTITIGGAIDGIGGGEVRAVNALIGLDLKDASGQTLNADGTPRTASGYGLVVHVNDGSAGQPNLPAEGTSDTATATISWTAQVPSNTSVVYLEAYPQAAGKTNESRYGHAMRHNVPIADGAPIDVHLPLVCAQGGTTGSIRGTATLQGSAMPLQRVVAWSIDPYDAVNRPTLGWNIGTANDDGTYVVPNLASGQKYQVWTTSTANEVRKTVGVAVSPCAETVRDVPYDEPTPAPTASPSASPAAPPPPPPPTVENGSSVITAGGVATLSGAAEPGATVELLAYSRPSTTYTVIRRTTAADTGAYSFSIRPQTNTRLLVRVDGQQSSSVVVGVRPAISLRAVRTAVRSYTFTGRVQPIRPGQIVSVFAETGSGNVLVGRGRVGSDGSWTATHRFSGNGTYGLFAVTGADMVSAAGRSGTVRTAVR